MGELPHPSSWPNGQIAALGSIGRLPPVDQIMHVRTLGPTLYAVFKSGDRYVRAPVSPTVTDAPSDERSGQEQRVVRDD